MQQTLNIGIDVAKAELVIGVADHPQYNLAIANTASAIKRWLGHVPEHARLAVESTGPYHRLVVDLAQARGLHVYVLNALEVHYYAKSLGQRGKTDRSDAQVISRYLGEHHARLHPFQAGTRVEQSVERLLRRRAQLTAQRDAMRMTLRDVPELKQETAALLAHVDDFLAGIQAHIEHALGQQAELLESWQRLQSTPGIGPQGAALLTCLFHRVPFESVDALVAFSGLDPRPKDSGQKHGRRRLSKRGPALLRRQLFMMAFSASRTPVFKPYYQALRTRGLSTTESFVILGRKLLKIAFGLWRTQTYFEANRHPIKII